MKRTPLKRSTKPMKRSKLRKSSKTYKSRLKKKLWDIFSKFIRQRDKYTCFTCGRKGEGSSMHAGHFISKQIGGIELYFSEVNVNCQCYNCNINLGGNLYIYGQKLGKDICDELYRIKNEVRQEWSEEKYLQKIEYYKKLI